MSLPSVCVDLLRGGRAEFNRRFELARHQFPQLDADAFLAYLRAPVAPLVAKVDAAQAGSGARTLDALYDIGLALLGQRWIGPTPRQALIESTWSALAERAPVLLAADPRRLLAATANALVHFASDGDGAGWSRTWLALAERARAPDALLRAGQVAAWRHGLAHFRDSALQQAGAVEDELLAIVFDLPRGGWRSEWLPALRRDRWFQPGEDALVRPYPAARVGAFVGFGGVFAAPPLAVAGAHGLLLLDGPRLHALHADAYGASLHPIAAKAGGASASMPTGWSADGAVLQIGRTTINLASGGAITSVAMFGDTAVVTQSLTHAATVLALPP